MESFMNPSCNWFILRFEFRVLFSSIVSDFFLYFSINVIHVYSGMTVIVTFFWAMIFRASCKVAGRNHGDRHSDLNSMSVTLFWFLVNWNWNSSDNWNFLHVRLRNWVISIYFYFIELWFLNMMNVVLLIVFLNNWLSDGFFTGNGNCLELFNIINITFGGQRF